MNRQENLIQILLKAEKPLTTQELAEQLNVSSRTIRSDLEKIESEILVHSMKLEKKQRVGIWIEGTQDEKDALFLRSRIEFADFIGIERVIIPFHQLQFYRLVEHATQRSKELANGRITATARP